MDTTEEMMEDKAYCQECSKGCLKCVKETAVCQYPDMDEGGDPGMEGGDPGMEGGDPDMEEGNPGMEGGQPPTGEDEGENSYMKVPKCVRCDKDLGFYLYKDRCVRECPNGSYPDKLTGWCSKCDCNCGTGGCTDRYSCKSCPQPGMVKDKETGKCKCDVPVSGAWADDWKSFTITIESLNVKFRNLMMEENMMEFNSQKMCRIGNEPMMPMSNDEIKTEDVDYWRCGDDTRIDDELEYLNAQYKGIMHEDKTSSDDIPNSMSTKGSPSESVGNNTPSLYGKQGGPMNSDEEQTNMETEGEEPQMDEEEQEGNPPMNVNNKSEQCPAKKQKMNNDELLNSGIESFEGGLYKYINSLEIKFGDFNSNDLQWNRSPTDGLLFTTLPVDLCSLLFSEETISDIFKNPTCTVSMTETETKIMVQMGENAMIHPDFVLKVQPNVFTDGCDWPIVNVIKLDNGADPQSLKVRYEENKSEAVVCTDYFLKLNSEGNVGDLDCELNIESAHEEDGTEVEGESIKDIQISIAQSNEQLSSNGELKFTKEQLQSMKNFNVKKIKVQGVCKDAYGQEVMVKKEISLESGSSEIKLGKTIEKIPYNPAEGYTLSMTFDYKNCEGMATTVTRTYTLQKLDTDGTTWMDVMDQDMIIQNNKIPTGLSSTMKFRVKITASVSNTNSKEFFISLEFIQKQPKIVIDSVPTFIQASDEFGYDFTMEDFENVKDISSLSLSFSCTHCDGSQCKDQDDNEIDFNSYYNMQEMSLMVPENTFKQDT